MSAFEPPRFISPAKHYVPARKANELVNLNNSKKQLQSWNFEQYILRDENILRIHCTRRRENYSTFSPFSLRTCRQFDTRAVPSSLQTFWVVSSGLNKLSAGECEAVKVLFKSQISQMDFLFKYPWSLRDPQECKIEGGRSFRIRLNAHNDSCAFLYNKNVDCFHAVT